jgi:DUF4097 and DUF4098 domain-containing protein YvlB
MFVALGTTACRVNSQPAGTFDRTLSVSGAVVLDLHNAVGDTQITVGPAGELRIHGELRVRSWLWGDRRGQVQQTIQNPPITQQGNLIRIGGSDSRNDDLDVDYTIIAPPQTEVHGVNGKGNLSVAGVEGPLNLSCDKGDIAANAIQGDVHASAGKGDLSLAGVHGSIEASSGKGNINVASAEGTLRAHAGAGDISIAAPAAAVVAETARGDIHVTGALHDLRLHSVSGALRVEGNPLNRSYWDFQTSSGSVDILVPSSASFRLHAHSRSGNIATSIPLVVEEKTSKHELRARIGEGQGRVDVDTSSGNITLH